ncbi:flagellar hook-basal body complex protein [Clostridium gasigenes]|uniref:flagellar hook-basal body complex protein n=1 Tax=Clostridium gasigenes TaxID=94869 RepID=UPI003F49B993
MGYSLTNDDSSKEATAKEPNNLSTAGLDFKFGPGSQLNGYKVVLGAVGPGTVATADIDKNQKLIIVNGDFSTVNGLTAGQVESAVNKGLSSAGVSQQIFISGKPINIADLASEGIKGGADATSPNAVTIGGFTLQLNEGSGLNGFTFEIGKVGTGTILKANIEADTKKIKIDGDFVTKGNISATALKEEINAALKNSGIRQEIVNISGSPMNLANVAGKTDTSGTDAAVATGTVTDSKGVAIPTGTLAGMSNFVFANGSALNKYKVVVEKGLAGSKTEVLVNKDNNKITIKADFAGKTATELKNEIPNAFNTSLSSVGITTSKLTSFDLTTVDTASMANILVIDGGKDDKAPKSINIAGLTINLPKGSKFNGLEIEIGDARATNLEVDAKPNVANPTKLIINGDFVSPNGVTSTALENEINTKLGLTGDGKITVGGTAKVYTGLTSDKVEGGGELMTAGLLELGSMEFTFTSGGALNGYKIQIGKITAGTKSDAKIDEKNKTITIDGDFTTPGAMTTDTVANKINKELQDAGIYQAIIVKGKTMEIGGTESGITTGGTPVQSLGADGVLSFVDGTKTLKAYDGQLKTLKIPDKVKIPGTDLELRVKTYTIDSTGIINGVLEDGRVAALGQIAMSNFKNPEGLAKLGGNLYSSSVNSGDAIIKSGIGTLGDDNSKGYGDNLQGMLEMSNVDLAEQFTDMIISSRAFQASGKMITTGDEILQDIINLKR